MRVGVRSLAILGPDHISEPAAEMMPSFTDSEDIGNCGDSALHDDFHEDCLPKKMIRLDNTEDVTQFLAPVPGDCSYFTKSVSSMPVRPEYWRPCLVNKCMFCCIAFAACRHKIV